MENIPLGIGIVAAVALVWWLAKKLFKLALFAAVVGAVAWYWYFNTQ